jgi:hypothetical protein
MSVEAPSLLTDDNIPSPFETLWKSTGVFKINTHIQGHFISLHFHCSAIHCNTVLSSMAKPNSSFSILPCLLHKLSCILNYYPFQSLQFEGIQMI